PARLDVPPPFFTGHGEHCVTLGVDPRELRLDLFRVGEPGGDLLPPRLEDLEDWLVSERPQRDAHDAETGALREQMNPVDGECRHHLPDLPTTRGLKRNENNN